MNTNLRSNLLGVVANPRTSEYTYDPRSDEPDETSAPQQLVLYLRKAGCEWCPDLRYKKGIGHEAFFRSCFSGRGSCSRLFAQHLNVLFKAVPPAALLHEFVL